MDPAAQQVRLSTLAETVRRGQHPGPDDECKLILRPSLPVFYDALISMRLIIALTVLVSFWPRPGHAQPQQTGQQALPTSAPAASSAQQQAIETLQKEMKELRARDAARAEEIAQMRAEMASAAEPGEEPEEPEEGLAEAERAGKILDIYGFMDVSLVKNFIAEDSVIRGTLREPLTFLMNRINVFLHSQMTHSLSALIEVRLSFMPLGHVESLESNTLGSDYDRVDTTVKDPFFITDYRMGGIMIERAHFSYRFNEYIGVLAGRFLTPFGIWNVDHASTIIIPVRQPFIILQQTVPLAQTGVLLFGRAFATNEWIIDYSFSISNGRGPIESVYDLDDNKGLGLRLRVTYERDDLSVAFGGYGYWGDYTDVVDSFEVDEGPRFETRRTVAYTEWTGALDLLVKYKGLHWQSEAAGTLRKYEIRPQLGLPFNLPLPAVTGGDVPDHYQASAYSLLAYELPITRRIGGVRIRPYFMFEWQLPLDARALYFFAWTGGVNVQPLPWLTLKVEGMHLWVDLSGYGVPLPSDTDSYWAFLSQAAVSF